MKREDAKADLPCVTGGSAPIKRPTPACRALEKPRRRYLGFLRQISVRPASKNMSQKPSAWRQEQVQDSKVLSELRSPARVELQGWTLTQHPPWLTALPQVTFCSSNSSTKTTGVAGYDSHLWHAHFHHLLGRWHWDPVHKHLSLLS